MTVINPQGLGSVGLTVANVDGVLRVVTSSGDVVFGVKDFRLVAGLDDVPQLTMTVMCARLEAKT